MTHRAPRSRLAFALTALALVVMHVGLVNYFMPLSLVLDDEPLCGDDYDLHVGQVYRVVQGLRGWGKSWVYDVELLAGQPEGTISDAGSKGWELWTYVGTLLGARIEVAFDSFVLFAMLSAPLWIFVAARVFGLGAWASLLTAALASLIWFFDSFAHWVWWIGMISYAFASSLALLPLALFHRYLETRRLALIAICAPLTGVVHLIHPYAFFTLAPPMAALYARAFRRLPGSGHAAVAAIAVVTLAMNAFWLRVSLEHWHYILDSAYYGQADPRYLFADFLNLLVTPADTGVIGTRTAFRFLCFGLGLAGLLVLRRERDARFLPLSVALSALLVLAYFGGQVPGAEQVQPYRHILPATFFALLPVAVFAEWLVRTRALTGLHAGVKALLAVGALACAQQLATQIAYFLPNRLADPQRFADGTPSIISKYGYLVPAPHLPSHVHYGMPRPAWLEPGYEQTLAFVRTNVAPGERMLLDNTVLGERIAWSTDVEVMGGFLERNTDHAFANFFRHYRRRPVEAPELERYLRTFAIGWVMVQRWRFDFERAPQLLERVQVIGGRTLYRTRIPIAHVLQGSGRVRAKTNSIDVSDSDPSRDLVLSYHFHEALRCAPSCRVERERIEFDAVGLIRVPAPHPPKLRIYNAYP